MITINIKPLSVNKAWMGRRFKTQEYKSFEYAVLMMLPKLKVPDGKLQVEYVFGFSSSGSDLDNPEKMITDILSKKYKFNDNRIYRKITDKVIVKKGCEFIKFKIEGYEKANT